MKSTYVTWITNYADSWLVGPKKNCHRDVSSESKAKTGEVKSLLKWQSSPGSVFNGQHRLTGVSTAFARHLVCQTKAKKTSGKRATDHRGERKLVYFT